MTTKSRAARRCRKTRATNQQKPREDRRDEAAQDNRKLKDGGKCSVMCLVSVPRSSIAYENASGAICFVSISCSSPLLPAQLRLPHDDDTTTTRRRHEQRTAYWILGLTWIRKKSHTALKARCICVRRTYTLAFLQLYDTHRHLPSTTLMEENKRVLLFNVKEPFEMSIEELQPVAICLEHLGGMGSELTC